jgi:hypothetical protein
LEDVDGFLDVVKLSEKLLETKQEIDFSTLEIIVKETKKLLKSLFEPSFWRLCGIFFTNEENCLHVTSSFLPSFGQLQSNNWIPSNSESLFFNGTLLHENHKKLYE